ncbi:delta(14)-sterol reductase LBR [Pelodytes ibericus]
MLGRKYEDGEDVMGRWPGSSLYYEVKVVNFDIQTQLYTVRYTDGTELELKESDIKALNVFRNRKRSSVSPSRRRSRSRSRSPGRRSKSPSRTPKNGTQPSSLMRRELRKDVLKVHLTPLKLNDYDVRKSNGEPEGVVRKVTRQTVIQAKVEQQKNEKVLRYSIGPKKEEIVTKEISEKYVEEQKPAGRDVKQLEFGGTVGVFLMMLSLPPALYYLLNICLHKDGDQFFSRSQFIALWDPTVLGFFVLWLLVQAMLYMLPLGKVAVGLPLANGERLQYRINGFCALLLTLAAVAGMLYYKINLLYVYHNLLQFAASATVVSIVLSVYAYVRSFRASEVDLSPAGRSGNYIYTFFMGRELNTRIGRFDLKYFCVLHPGLIGWVVVNWIMLLAEMHTQKTDMPSLSMILVNSFQLLYVAHALWNEEGALTCMDIVHDGFGFMLAFGNLVWIPFIYSLQSFYLVNHPVDICWPTAAVIVALNTFGYFIFCSANNQKLAFRKNPDDPRLAYLKSIPTSTGRNLLVSSWWGHVRHPNYLGDIIMAWAWCLPCGFSHMLPYFYGIFLTGLLIHREIRDEQQCKLKYGPDWDVYCQHVPYRIIKYIY